MKTCTKCGISQPLINFNKESRNKDGLNTNCKQCVKKFRTYYAHIKIKSIPISKTCTKCGIEKPIDLFYMAKQFSDNHKSWCKDCDNKRMAVYRKTKNGKEKIRKTKHGNGRYAISMNRATKFKKLTWDITKEQYDSLMKLPCYYCDLPLCDENGIGIEGGIGLDRLDNYLGYLSTNVVQCCGMCNKVRNSFFTVEEMKTYVGPIIKKVKLSRPDTFSIEYIRWDKTIKKILLEPTMAKATMSDLIKPTIQSSVYRPIVNEIPQPSKAPTIDTVYRKL